MPLDTNETGNRCVTNSTLIHHHQWKKQLNQKFSPWGIKNTILKQQGWLNMQGFVKYSKPVPEWRSINVDVGKYLGH